MVNLRNANKTFIQDDWSNIKEYIYLFLDKWYWFFLCIVAGMGLSYLVFLSQEPVYQVEASMLIMKDSQVNSPINLFEETRLGSNTMIENQVGIIKSYSLNREVIEKLNWRVNWYRSGPFKNISLYKAEPFVVSEIPGEQNLAGVKLYLEVLSNSSYQISVSDKALINGTEVPVKLSREGQFGQPFVSQWFNFKLNNKGNMIPEVGAEYLFYFNDFGVLVNSYIRKLEVNLLTENSEILVFKIKGTEPMRDIDYLNELIKTHIHNSLDEKNKSSETAVRFIDLQLTGISDSLHDAAQRFSRFRSSNQVMDLSQKSMMASNKMAELESEKSLLEMRLKYFRNLQNYIGNAEQMKQVVAPSIVGISDPVFNNLVTTLIELYHRREILTYSVNARSPNLEVLEKEIRMTSKTLNENLENILANAESELLQYNDRIAELGGQIATLPVIEQQMINIRGRFEMNNEMNNFLLKKKAEASIALASNEASARTLDASLPETMKRLGPDLILFLVVGLLAGLLLPALILLIYDFFTGLIRSMDQLVQRTGLPVIGAIAHNSYPVDHPVLEHPRSAISESFRGLRGALQLIMPDPDMNVLSVQSTVPGEGKTFVAINLATIVAMNNKKVLLAECNMRKPELQKIMNMGDVPGLSDYLTGKAAMEEIIRETKIPGLYLVLSGKIPPNPAELLENSLFDHFIKEIRRRFDLILLDNAPIPIITDSLTTGLRSDANLFVFRQDFSRKDQIRFVNEIARLNHLQNVVLVMNDVKLKGNGYGGMSYGSYNYYYQHSGSYYADSPVKMRPFDILGIIRKLGKIDIKSKIPALRDKAMILGTKVKTAFFALSMKAKAVTVRAQKKSGIFK